MDFLNIHTERLQIRQLTVNDLVAFHRYRSDPEIARFQGFDSMTMEQAAAFITENATKRFGNAGEWVQYAIENRQNGNVVGDCAMKADLYDSSLAEIGISISQEYQRQGYASETVTGILGFLFQRQAMRRVVATADADNTASVALLRRTGFRQEGHFIENIFFKGRWGSEFQFALLKREWDEKHRL